MKKDNEEKEQLKKDTSEKGQAWKRTNLKNQNMLKKMLQLPIKSQRYCDLGVQKEKKYYKIHIKGTPQSIPGGAKAPKRLHIKSHYKTKVKVHSARSLCTRVQARSVF